MEGYTTARGDGFPDVNTSGLIEAGAMIIASTGGALPFPDVNTSGLIEAVTF